MRMVSLTLSSNPTPSSRMWGDVDATVFTCHTRQFDHFPDLRVGPGYVLQPGRQTESTLDHGAGDHLFHRLHFRRCWCTVGPAHRKFTHRVVTDEGAKIDRSRRCFEHTEQL